MITKVEYILTVQIDINCDSADVDRLSHHLVGVAERIDENFVCAERVTVVRSEEEF